MLKIAILLTLVPTLLFSKQEYIAMSHKISDKFVVEFSKYNKIHPYGLGGGMMCDIDLVSMTFLGMQTLDVLQARRMFVDGMETLLSRYNSNLELRPYLHTFPCTTDLFDFDLMFEDSSGKFVPEKFVACVYCQRGKIYYKYNDHKTDELKLLHEETYADAVRIVKDERNHISANSIQKTCL